MWCCDVVMCDVWWVTSSTRRHLTYQSYWGWNNQLRIILHTINRAREGDTMFCKIVNTRWVITKISCVCYDTKIMFWESRLHIRLRLRRFQNAKSEKAERLFSSPSSSSAPLLGQFSILENICFQTSNFDSCCCGQILDKGVKVVRPFPLFCMFWSWPFGFVC